MQQKSKEKYQKDLIKDFFKYNNFTYFYQVIKFCFGDVIIQRKVKVFH